MCAAAVLAAALSVPAAVGLAVGGAAGLANMLTLSWTNERLLASRSVGVFVLSSLIRILGFGILPVELALHGPWWMIAAYFAAFFIPLAVYAVMLRQRTDDVSYGKLE